MNKKEFFSNREIEQFDGIRKRFEAATKTDFNETYKKAVISKLRKDKNYHLDTPDLLQFIPNSLKTIEMCKESIGYNYTNIIYIPNKIQTSDDFIEYTISTFFENRRKINMLQKFLMYNMCDELFFTIKSWLDLKGMT